ncbi:MAG TPA: hypothetical protein VHD33_01355 [Legionellaceae bacterium]|nr:hypothetical protein [Legionellaceae bacterium]
MLNPDPIIIRHPSYIILKQILSEEACHFLTEYTLFKAKARPNTKKHIDPLDNVHREYADPVMELLLAQLQPLVQKALERDIWPSLSFYYVYTHGNALQKHTDRSSCEWVAGLCIGADPDFKTTHHTWPMQLKLDDGQETIALDYGDLLIFQGHTIEHWREPFMGQWFISAIFGYVEQDGPYAFQKYDQRKALGTPHIGMFRWAIGCLKNKLFKLI